MTQVQLKGMTWSHPRGFDPLVACSELWQAKTGIAVSWDKRSLQDFESFPVEQLARQYDLIVIDHPHMGQITHEGCLAPLDQPELAGALHAMAAQSVGASFPSYQWNGHQWALPIDAAAQVMAWRPDRLETPPSTWDEVLALAKRGEVLLPLRPPHSLMSFFTLCGNLGRPCSTGLEEPFADADTGEQAIELIRELAALIDPACLEMDPINVLDQMGSDQGKTSMSPLIYGYVSYALQGFRPARIAFGDIPVVGSNGPTGSALGGTGIAVSAFSAHREAAVDFACWVAGAEVQADLYWRSGGQPGHAAGWEDDGANEASLDFYRNTRQTMEKSWLRPRHNGYMPFQQAASDCINDAVRGELSPRDAIVRLNTLFRQSFNG